MLNKLTIDLSPKPLNTNDNIFNQISNITNTYNLNSDNVTHSFLPKYLQFYQTHINPTELQNQLYSNDFIKINNKKWKRRKKKYRFQPTLDNQINNAQILNTNFDLATNNIDNNGYYALDLISNSLTPTLVALGFACQNNVEDFELNEYANDIINQTQNIQRKKQIIMPDVITAAICGVENAQCIERICQCRPNYIQAGSSVCISQEKSKNFFLKKFTTYDI